MDKLHNKNPKSWVNAPTITELRANKEYADGLQQAHSLNVKHWEDLTDPNNNHSSKSSSKGKNNNRSTLKPKLIQKHTAWRYSTLSEPLLNSPKLFSIGARTYEDAEKARQNEILINWLMDTKIDKVAFIDKAIKFLVDRGTCAIRLGWDRIEEQVEVEKPVYDYFPVDVSVLEEMETAIASGEEVDDSVLASVEFSNANQVPVRAVFKGTTTETETKLTRNCPSIRVIDTRNLYIDPSCDGELSQANYIIHSYESTRAKLNARGIYKNLDKVSWDTEISSDTDHNTSTPDNDTRKNSTNKTIIVYEYWGEWDVNDDGTSIPITVTWIDDVIIHMEENPFPDKKPPFVMCKYMPVTGSCYGMPDAALLEDNQLIKGAILRGVIDLMGRSANSQVGYLKGFLDYHNKALFIAGHDFEFNHIDNIDGAIQQMKYPEIPASALNMLRMQDIEAESLSGVKTFSDGITGGAYGDVAMGITTAIDATAQREMAILRRISECLRTVGEKVLAMSHTFMSSEEVIRVTNEEFIEIKRDEIQGNFDMLVDIATAEVDEKRAQDWTFMTQTMGASLDIGMKKIITSKVAELRRMPDLADAIRKYEPEPDPMEEARIQAELDSLTAKTALDYARAEKEKAEAAKILQEIRADEAGITHARTMEKMQAQASSNADTTIAKALLDPDVRDSDVEAAIGYNTIASGGP